MIDHIPVLTDGSVEFVVAADVTAALYPHWDDLSAHAAFTSPFSERWNLQPALNFLANDEDVKLLLVWQDSSRRKLDALIPVVERRGELGILKHLQYWLHQYAYIGMPLVRNDRVESTMRALSRWLDRSAFCLLVFPQCYESAVGENLQQHPAIQIDPAFERASLLIADHEGQFAHHSAKKAKEYRRQLRRLQDQGYQLRRLSPGDSAAEISSVFLQLEASGWKGRAQTAFLSKQNDEDYLRCILAGAHLAGRLGFYYLSKEPLKNSNLAAPGQTVAVLLTIRTGNTELLYRTGFDENFARFSPGVLNVIAYSKAAVAEGSLSFCDSGAMPDHPMINKVWQDRVKLCTLTIAKKTTLVSLLLMLRRGYRKFKQLIRENIPVYHRGPADKA